MPLLEIVVGEQTSDAALAKAIDVALQIRKTPIVVNDSRGFFTSRVIGTVVAEAAALVGEGVPANSVEQAALQAGYPIGPLALTDEVSLTLGLKIKQAAAAAAEAEGVAVPGAPGLRGHREDGHGARARRPGRRRGLLRLRRGQEARPVERAEGRLRRGQPRHPVQGPAGADAVHRGDREHQVPRRGRPAHRCRTRTSARSSASGSRRGPVACCSTSNGYDGRPGRLRRAGQRAGRRRTASGSPRRRRWWPWPRLAAVYR